VRDRRLQELLQRLAQDASPEDEAAWIAERLRSGDLTHDSLELAAYLGSEPALAVLPAGALGDQAPKRGVRTFVKNLRPWGRSVCLRAAIAATRLLVTERDDRRRSARVKHLHLAEQYAVDPSPELIRELQSLNWRGDAGTAKWRAARLCSVIALQGPEGYFQWRAKEAVAEVADELRSVSKVRASIVAELLPWCLGYFDPVAARVAART
jgi:hypothetical protein